MSAGRTNVAQSQKSLEQVQGEVQEVTAFYTEDGETWLTIDAGINGASISALKGSVIYCVCDGRKRMSGSNVDAIHGDNTANYFGQLNENNFAIIAFG